MLTCLLFDCILVAEADLHFLKLVYFVTKIYVDYFSADCAHCLCLCFEG